MELNMMEYSVTRDVFTTVTMMRWKYSTFYLSKIFCYISALQIIYKYDDMMANINALLQIIQHITVYSS